MNPECSNCVAYDPRDKDKGICRRYPPTMLSTPNGPVFVQPLAMKTGFCCEWTGDSDAGLLDEATTPKVILS
jgi:hypothetical protein